MIAVPLWKKRERLFWCLKGVIVSPPFEDGVVDYASPGRYIRRDLMNVRYQFQTVEHQATTPPIHDKSSLHTGMVWCSLKDAPFLFFYFPWLLWHSRNACHSSMHFVTWWLCFLMHWSTRRYESRHLPPSFASSSVAGNGFCVSILQSSHTTSVFLSLDWFVPMIGSRAQNERKKERSCRSSRRYVKEGKERSFDRDASRRRSEVMGKAHFASVSQPCIPWTKK